MEVGWDEVDRVMCHGVDETSFQKRHEYVTVGFWERVAMAEGQPLPVAEESSAHHREWGWLGHLAITR